MLREEEDKRKLEKEAERKRLIAMSEYDAFNLPRAEWYQRLCYLREIDADKWLKEERRKMPITRPIAARTNKKRSYGSWGWQN